MSVLVSTLFPYTPIYWSTFVLEKIFTVAGLIQACRLYSPAQKLSALCTIHYADVHGLAFGLAEAFIDCAITTLLRVNSISHCVTKALIDLISITVSHVMNFELYHIGSYSLKSNEEIYAMIHQKLQSVFVEAKICINPTVFLKLM